MKQPYFSRLLNAIGVLTLTVSIPVIALAQEQSQETQKPAEQTRAEQAKPEQPGKEAEALVITRKEVAAVQAELQRRGYYRNTPSGVLDTQTREAIATYQKENQLEESGQIDMALINSLELKYPATGKEVESARKKGLIPRIGYATRDAATATRDTTVNAGKSVKKTSEKAVDVTVDKSLNLAKDAGDVTVKGAKKTGDATTRAGKRVGEVFVGRSDADIQNDIRSILEKKEETKRVRSEVKDGAVRLFAKDLDLSDAVTEIRKLSGIKSVVVVAK